MCQQIYPKNSIKFAVCALRLALLFVNSVVCENLCHLWETKINLSQLTKVNATANCNFATSQVLDSYVVALLSKFQLQKLVRFLRFPRFLRFVGK